MFDSTATGVQYEDSTRPRPLDPPSGEEGLLTSVTEVALSLGTAPAGTDVRRLMCERLWRITGAVVLSLTLYDEKAKAFRVHHSASSNRVYSTVLSVCGPMIYKRPYPVSDALYAYIMTQGHGVCEGCYELLHGQVPRPVCAIVDRVLGIGYTYGFGLTFGDTLLGALSIMMPKHAPKLPADAMNAYSAIAAAALHQAQITEELHSYQSRLRSMSTKLHQAEEGERRRIACSIHDNIAQSLVHLKLRLAELNADGDGGVARVGIAELSGQLDEIIRSVYDVTYDLSPPVLYELGLHSALDWLLQGVREREGLAGSLHWTADGRSIPREIEVQAFHLVREMVRNVVKHADADSVRVDARLREDRLLLEVIDDGIGLVDDPTSSAEPEPAGGFGVFSVRERVRDLGGEFDILPAPNRGTRVAIQLPLKRPTGANS